MIFGGRISRSRTSNSWFWFIMVRVIGQFRWIDWFESEKKRKRLPWSRLIIDYLINIINFCQNNVATYISFRVFSNLFIGFKAETDYWSHLNEFEICLEMSGCGGTYQIASRNISARKCTFSMSLQIDSLINVICNLQLIKSMARDIEAGPQIRNPFITQLRATFYKYN